jgi:hypothetical protein
MITPNNPEVSAGEHGYFVLCGSVASRSYSQSLSALQAADVVSKLHFAAAA